MSNSRIPMAWIAKDSYHVRLFSKRPSWVRREGLPGEWASNGSTFYISLGPKACKWLANNTCCQVNLTLVIEETPDTKIFTAPKQGNSL